MTKPYEIKDILADNVNALMANSRDLSSNLLVESRSGGAVKKSTLQRIRARETACDLTTLARVAHVFGLSPWQLLVPGLDPANPVTLPMASPTEAAMYAKMKELMELARASEIK